MSISHFVLSSSFKNAAPFHLFSPSVKKCGTLLIFSSRPDARRGGITSLFKIEDRSANYLTIIIMTMTTGTLGNKCLVPTRPKTKKSLSLQRVVQKLPLHMVRSPGSAGPTTCVFAFADISGQLGHQAQRTYPAQPWFLVWS